MHLQVHSLKKTLFDGEAESINCKTTSGEITVLKNHRPLITALAPGVLTIVDKSEKKEYINVSSGFLEIQNNRASIIINEAPA